MTTDARKRISKEFDITNVINKYAEIYYELF